MPEQYLGEVRIVGFGFVPKGWALCNGQLMSINQNQALFALLGTTYGGDGRTTFALPNLQGRVPMHVDNNNSAFTPQGKNGGETTHTLTIPELPAHTHQAVGSSSNPATSPNALNNLWGYNSNNPYAPTAGSAMNPAGISPAGNSLPHENMSPYLALNFIIALTGIFPSRS